MSYDARLVSEWDQTAQISFLLGALTSITINANSKAKSKPKSMSYYHPYRETKPAGNTVSAKNIKSLLAISDALRKQK